MDTTAVFAPLLKSEKQEDGSLLVTGLAADPTLDIDEQRCDPEWLKAAMPKWFQWGNIREQHSQVAAGVATEYKQADGDKHVITARVVDPNSIKKVEAGVLKGFSIGIKNHRLAVDKDARGGRIIDGEIVEVSLVDRPANPACRLTVAKSATAGVEVSPDEFDKGLVKVEDLQEGVVEADVTSEKAAETDADAGTATETVATPAADIIQAAKDTYKGVTPDLTKWDAAAYNQAWKAVAALIIKEAQEMQGGEDETFCISMLLRAASHLATFRQYEIEEGETDGSDAPSSMDDTAADVDAALRSVPLPGQNLEPAMSLGAEPDVTKAVTDGDTPDDTPELLKSLTPDVKEWFTEVVREATKDIAESVGDLTERVSKVEKAASSKGPVRTVVTKAAGATATTPETNLHLAKAAEYRSKALSTQDKALAAGYLQLAVEQESLAAAKSA